MLFYDLVHPYNLVTLYSSEGFSINRAHHVNYYLLGKLSSSVFDSVVVLLRCGNHLRMHCHSSTDQMTILLFFCFILTYVNDNRFSAIWPFSMFIHDTEWKCQKCHQKHHDYYEHHYMQLRQANKCLNQIEMTYDI